MNNCLHSTSLEDVLARFNVLVKLVRSNVLVSSNLDVAEVADPRQQIHWDWCQALLLELERFTSRHNTRLTSSQKYAFGRDRMVAFVKRSLVEVENIDHVQRKVETAIQQYKRAHSHSQPPLFRLQ